MGGKELKWRPLAHHQLMSQQGPHFSYTLKLKPIIKAQITEKLITSGISDVAIASLHSEKTRLKKMIMIIIMNKSQEIMFFGGSQKLTSAMKHIKFEALYK